jgi:hypothetical protein
MPPAAKSNTRYPDRDRSTAIRNIQKIRDAAQTICDILPTVNDEDLEPLFQMCSSLLKKFDDAALRMRRYKRSKQGR